MSWTYRVKHSNVRIFPGSTIHGGEFLNSKSTGNARIQLHVYKKKAILGTRLIIGILRIVTLTM